MTSKVGKGSRHDEADRPLVNNNIDGLIASVNDGSTSAFMWEWFTTKPYLDRGLVRFVSSRWLRFQSLYARLEDRLCAHTLGKLDDFS